MRETKIRFGQRAWALIQEEASLDGVSASQFVREAAIARAVYIRAEREPMPVGEAVNDIIQQLRAEEQSDETRG